METRSSVASLVDCPDLEVLFEFFLGLLPHQEVETIAEHLTSCTRCETALNEMQSGSGDDSVVDQVKRCLGQSGLREEPGLARLEKAARAIRFTKTVGERGTVVSERGTGSLIGRIVGGYEVLDKISQGGMGVVYRVRQLALNRVAALKMILTGVHAHPEMVARFRTEGEAIARLDHPNVVKIYDFGECDGLLYYSMEYVEGGTLAGKLGSGPLLPQDAAKLVRTLALTVEFAHQRQVLHRDLKPGNILLANDGVPKISDFGLAKLLDAEGEGQTISEMILGTPAYMAPEQALGRAGDINRPADIYGLGAILYETLTGHAPFRAETKAETLNLVRSAEVVPPQKHRPGVPSSLADVCLKCLKKVPAQRYTSAQALADDLERFLQDKTPEATPRWYERVARTLRRYAALIVIGVCLTAAAAAVYTIDPDRPLRVMQSQLKAGQEVTLIGETGKPKWMRWRQGEKVSTHSQSPEGAFAIHTWGLSLVELLPDPQTERYRLSAQVRHEKSNLHGEVGLFVGHQAFPWARAPADVHFFLQETFNDVRTNADLPIIVGNPKPPLPTNLVDLFPHLHSEQGVPFPIDSRMTHAVGPEFKPAGENQGGWHDLEITVTPEGVTAQWDGKSFGMTAATIAESIAQELKFLQGRLPESSPVHAMQPTFMARGGLGLYLLRGSASFRAVTVTPLGNRQ